MNIPVFLFSVATPFIVLFIVTLNLKYYQLKKRRSPFTDNFLRSPGESLNNKIQDLSEKLAFHLVVIMVLPSIILPFHSIPGATQNRTIPILFAAVLIFITYFIVKLLQILNMRRHIQLGYEGEVAVGQELNQLMLTGYHVYHDFVADKFNIDHILVGSSGVYAVETKARSKPISKNGKVKYKVISNGKTLRFPNYIESDTLKQADRQAKWLSTWLGKAIGDSVRVQPVVALPGWLVDRVSRDGIPVLNQKQFRSFLGGQKNDVLSESMIQRITHQLEQKCRNIEPKTIRDRK